MIMVFAVGLGGAIGAVCRYLLSSGVTHVMGTQFPWGILLVNIIGGLAMGVIAETGAQSAQLSLELKTFLTTGILGGFTTFSAFSLDTALLIERGDMMNAALYVSGSVLGSIAALFAGLWAVRMVVA
jgi:CrcB protein